MEGIREHDTLSPEARAPNAATAAGWCVKLMNCVLKMRNCELKMMDFVLKMIDLYLKMMNFGRFIERLGGLPRDLQAGPCPGEAAEGAGAGGRAAGCCGGAVHETADERERVELLYRLEGALRAVHNGQAAAGEDLPEADGEHPR